MNAASSILTTEDCQRWAWLFPFQGVLYYDHAWVIDYLLPLNQWLPFDFEDELAYNEVIQEAQDQGFLYPIPGSYALMQINAQFLAQLRLKIVSSYGPDFFAALELAFLGHYQNICTEIRRLQLHTDHLEQDPINELVKLEWPNIYRALQVSIQQGQDSAILSSVLRAFFKSQSWLQDWIPLAQTILAIVPDVNLVKRISCLDDLGTTYLDLNQPEQARPFLQEAWSLLNQLDPDTENLALIKCVLCNNLSRSEPDFPKQRKWLSMAYDIAKTAGLHDQMAIFAYNLSELLFENRLFKESEQLLQDTLPTFRENRASGLLVQALLSLAIHERLKGAFDQAEAYLLEALTEENGTLRLAEIQQELASLYYEAHRLSEAQDLAHQALTVFLEYGSIRQEGNALNLLSAIAFTEANLQDGLEYAQRALACFAQSGEWAQMGQTFSNIAIMCFEQEWWEEALDYSLKAYDSYRKIQNEAEAARQQLLMTTIYLELDRLEEAQIACNQASAVFRALGDEQELQNVTLLQNEIDRLQMDCSK